VHRLTLSSAEFRGPGRHHRFDDSADDDYDMDMDQRTRMLGRGDRGRIILLGDGTEIHTDMAHDDDGDVDMEDRGEAEEDEGEEKDLAEQVRKGQSEAKSEANGKVEERSAAERKETPGPSANSSEATSTVEEVKPDSPEQSAKAGTGSTNTPEEPKMSVPVDGVDNKKIIESQSQSSGSK